MHFHKQYTLALILLAICVTVATAKGKRKKKVPKPPQWRDNSDPADNTTSSVRMIGQRMTFRCGANSRPRPKITWLKNGLILSSSMSKRMVMRKHNLMLSDLMKSDSGNYTCILSNRIGNIQWNHELRVKGKWKIPKNVTVAIGDTATFVCGMNTRANYSVRWVRFSPKGKRIVFNSQYFPKTTSNSNDVLRIERVRYNDAGLYTCWTGDRFSVKTFKVWLNIARPQTTAQTTTTTTPTTSTTTPTTTTTTPTTTTTTPTTTTTTTPTTTTTRPTTTATTTSTTTTQTTSVTVMTTQMPFPTNYVMITRRHGRKRDRKRNKKQRNRDRHRKRPAAGSRNPKKSRRMHKYRRRTTMTPLQPRFNEKLRFDEGPRFSDDDLEVHIGHDVTTESRFHIAEDHNEKKVDNGAFLFNHPSPNNSTHKKSPSHASFTPSISLWTIYVIVGSIAGGILLIGLVTIIVAVLCHRADDTEYKSTTV